MKNNEAVLREALETVLKEGLPVGPGYVEVEAKARAALAATATVAKDGREVQRIECAECGTAYRHALNCTIGDKEQRTLEGRDYAMHANGWNSCLAALELHNAQRADEAAFATPKPEASDLRAAIDAEESMQIKVALMDELDEASAEQPAGATGWTDWPDGSGVGGYYWTKASEDAPIALVYVTNAKDGHKLALWECPGIGRDYVDYTSSRRFKGLAAPISKDTGKADSSSAAPSEKCKACNGTGEERGARGYPCPKCDGLGEPVQSLATPSPTRESLNAAARAEFIRRVLLEVAELPDRDSPEDQPEMMLVTHEELRSILTSGFELADEAAPTVPGEPT